MKGKGADISAPYCYMKIIEKIKDFRDFLEFLNTYKRQLRQPTECKDFDGKKCKINIYFGLPGAGKTTYAAVLAAKSLKKGYAVYSNVPITGCYELDAREELGRFEVSNGRIILDESGVQFGARDYKNFGKELIFFFKYHRHFNTAVDVFSQAPDDMDKIIRNLAYNVYWIRKSVLPAFIYIVPIERTLDIIDGDIRTSYIIHDGLFSRKYVYCRPYWKMFNTLARPELPRKEWRVY